MINVLIDQTTDNKFLGTAVTFSGGARPEAWLDDYFFVADEIKINGAVVPLNVVPTFSPGDRVVLSNSNYRIVGNIAGD